MSILETLTEGIVNRNMEARRCCSVKQVDPNWTLLEGLEGQKAQNMAVLLENQAKQLLKESSGLAMVVESMVSLLLHSQSFVVYSPDLSLTIL